MLLFLSRRSVSRTKRYQGRGNNMMFIRIEFIGCSVEHPYFSPNEGVSLQPLYNIDECCCRWPEIHRAVRSGTLVTRILHIYSCTAVEGLDCKVPLVLQYNMTNERSEEHTSE